MSWDAFLIDDRGHYEGEWNYTHNCNRMIHAALDRAGVELPASTRACRRLEDGEWVSYPNGVGTISWFDHLDGMTGPDGAAFLDLVLREFKNDPQHYEAMNPTNGWGSFESLVRVLTEMRDRVPEWPTNWSAGG